MPCVRALQFLLPRDRTLIEWLVAEVPLEEQATRLGITYTAARQARHRALGRFRDAFAALARAGAWDRAPGRDDPPVVIEGLFATGRPRVP